VYLVSLLPWGLYFVSLGGLMFTACIWSVWCITAGSGQPEALQTIWSLSCHALYVLGQSRALPPYLVGCPGACIRSVWCLAALFGHSGATHPVSYQSGALHSILVSGAVQPVSSQFDVLQPVSGQSGVLNPVSGQFGTLHPVSGQSGDLPCTYLARRVPWNLYLVNLVPYSLFGHSGAFSLYIVNLVLCMLCRVSLVFCNLYQVTLVLFSCIWLVWCLATVSGQFGAVQLYLARLMSSILYLVSSVPCLV
jgi:hypothetical protein